MTPFNNPLVLSGRFTEYTNIFEHLAKINHTQYSIYSFTEERYINFEWNSDVFPQFLSKQQKTTLSDFFCYLPHHDTQELKTIINNLRDTVIEQSAHNQDNYQFVTDLCLQNPKGSYCRLLHQAILCTNEEPYDIALCICHVVKTESEYHRPMCQLIQCSSHKQLWHNKQCLADCFYLTNRELEILTHIAQGKETNEIATRLFVSNNTICNHRNNILRKLQLHNMNQATLYASRLGLI